MPDSEVYERLLRPKGHGQPFWNPEPDNNLPDQYRRRGVSIGDVGIITSDGEFDFLFSICEPFVDNTIDPHDAPTFEMVSLADGDISKRAGYHTPDNPIASENMARKQIGADVSTQSHIHIPLGFAGGLHYTSSTNEGAILLLPGGASRQNLRNKKDKFLQQALAHGATWYKYANQTCGRMAENGSLYLVTGCDKGPSWGITAFSNTSGETGVFLNFTAAQEATAGVSYSHQWKVDSPAAVRTGPCAPDWQTLQGHSSSDQHLDHTARGRFNTVWNNLLSSPPIQPSIENQCVFARGHYIWLGGGLMKRLGIRPELYVTPENKVQDYSRSKVIPFVKEGGTKSMESSKTASGRGGRDNINAFETSDAEDDVLVETVPKLTEIYSPSRVISDFLFKEQPEAIIAVIHDEEVNSLLRKNETVFPNDDELTRRIFDTFEVQCPFDETAVCLREKSPPLQYGDFGAPLEEDAVAKAFDVTTGGIASAGSDSRAKYTLLSHSQNVISNMAVGIELRDDHHPSKSGLLANLDNTQHTHIRYIGELVDLENGISDQQKAVELTNDRHPSKPGRLSNLGIAQHTRFQYIGDLADLENAILNQQKAVHLTDDGHPDQPIYLSNLGIAQQTRFKHLGNLSDLDIAISNIEKAVVLMDDGHPDKPIYLSNLSIAQQTRFEHLRNLSELENAISNIEKAVLLMDDGHPDKPIYLSNLSIAQQTCFEHLGNLSDLENAISNIGNAVSLTDDRHPSKPVHLSNLGIAQQARFEHLGNLSDLENAISNNEKAVELTDGGHPSRTVHLSNLGIAQQARFKCLGNLSDLENAISNIAKAVELTDGRHPSRPVYLSNLGIAQQICFDCLGNLSDLDIAISNIEKAVVLMDDRHPDKPIYLSNLSIAQQTRFEHLGNLSDLDNAISNIEYAVELTVGRHPSRPVHLSNLGIAQQARFKHLGNLSDLENSISNIAKAVELTDGRHPSRPVHLSNLGIAQQARFEHLGNFSDLENAISNIAKAAELTDGQHPSRPGHLLNLGIA